MNQDLILKKINQISKEFLCTFPLISFDWQNIFETFLSENLQEYLLNKTVNSEIVLKYPIQINYQKLFLKHVLEELERLQNPSIEETVIHDDVYSAYGRLVATGGVSHENYKHYSLDNENKVITLKESNSLISDGTTGLRTWQASLVLSEWIIQNKHVFNDKHVLELGSGIGLTGLVLRNVCLTKTIYLTDCHEAVLEILSENVKLDIAKTSNDNNVIENRNQSDCKKLENRCIYTYTDSCTISILNLPWESVTPGICKELGVIEKVIAADIVFDDELFESLIKAMKCLNENCGVEEFIFACTERNPETLGAFLELISQHFQHIDQLPVPPQSTFLWPTDTPIKIYRFKD